MSEKFFRNSSKAIIMRIYCRNGENLNSFVVVFSRDKTGLNGFDRLVLNLQIWCNVLPIFRICLAFFSIVSPTDCISTSTYTKQTILLSNMQQKDTIDWQTFVNLYFSFMRLSQPSWAEHKWEILSYSHTNFS